MSNKATSAVNQQGSLRDPSETTRRAPFSQKAIKAYLLGALHDATFSSNRRYRFSQKGTEWLKFLQKLFKKVGYNSWIYKEGSDRDIYVLETLASFLDFSFNPRRLSGINEKVSYIRGFFDAEGGIPHNKEARFYIQLVQKNKQKLVEIKRILSELNIDVGKIHNPSKKVDPDLWRIYILSNSKERFVKIIGSWHSRKIDILRKRMMI
jgi:intein-encoded DNA endonuclease-like protein